MLLVCAAGEGRSTRGAALPAADFLNASPSST